MPTTHLWYCQREFHLPLHIVGIKYHKLQNLWRNVATMLKTDGQVNKFRINKQVKSVQTLFFYASSLVKTDMKPKK